MGSSVILTKNDPSELATIVKAEAFQISLLGGATGEQQLKEQHGWWDEQNQKAEWLVTTLAPDTALPFDEAHEAFHGRVAKRGLEGFVHSRSYNFEEGKFVYHDLRRVPGFERAKAAVSGNR
jgi:hypothetical protein